MGLKRMDNVGIVVEDLGGAIDFFRELGFEPPFLDPQPGRSGPADPPAQSGRAERRAPRAVTPARDLFFGRFLGQGILGYGNGFARGCAARRRSILGEHRLLSTSIITHAEYI
jgi:hypothetical protein